MTDFTIAQLPRRKLARHPNSLLPIEQNQSVGLQFYLVGYGTKTRKFFPIIRRCRRSCRATYRKLHLIVLTHKINHIGDSTGTSISERWIPRPSVEINRTHGIVERQWSHIIRHVVPSHTRVIIADESVVTVIADDPFKAGKT